MDNTYSKRKHVAMPLNLPIYINKDGSASTSLKLSISTKQLDENTKITVDLKPADEFTSMAKYEIGIGVNGRKKKTKKISFNESKQNMNDGNSRILKVTRELKQKNLESSNNVPCVSLCEAICQKNPSSTNIKDSVTKQIAPSKLNVPFKNKETLNEQIEKNSREKPSVLKERVKIFQEKLVKSKDKENLNKQIEENPQVHNSVEKSSTSKERVEPSQEKLVSSEDKETLNEQIEENSGVRNFEKKPSTLNERFELSREKLILSEDKETFNEQIEENLDVRNSEEKPSSPKERVELSHEKLVSSIDQKTEVVPKKLFTNEKKKYQKYALNTKPSLFFEIHNESIICTEEPEGVLEEGGETIWINSYYDDEMKDLRKKLTQIESDIKNFDSSIFRENYTEDSYIFEEETKKQTNIKWNLQRQLEIVLANKDIKIDKYM